MSTQPFEGVLAPVLTPFDDNLKPDGERMLALCRQLIEEGCDGLAVFGTTGEANSQSGEERMALLETLVEGGVTPAKLMPGTGACSIDEAVRLNAQAVALGCGGVLMLPPFFYKGVDDDGLFSFFSEVIERVGDARLKVYLYHIPPQTSTPISLDLIERLLKAWPDTVVGLKDSSGDWSNTEAILKNFPGFGTFAGSESFLLDTLRGGGIGCITATGNVNAAAIRNVFANWQRPDADALQDGITRTRKIIQSRPMVPALKAIVSCRTGDAGWNTLRPPLTALTQETQLSLFADLDADKGFPAMPTTLSNAAE